ncbi:uncharacterized protein HD556DRAFT_1460877 [Suillus plorans]|uniref:Uncharacterized protein n=1 Tax=Suillus plorans TaxID=116603 RepID=A0A9P7ABF1_9AGAM|nr:uncharacterized protein HD556DRAFT_1460877 [Suillus plorans]KAG1785060.1 hypothetical protein HD556DRAFT_1460877 [Suillus plorans]
MAVDRFHLHSIILQELQLWDEANTLLESDVGKSICSASLVCNETHREIWRKRGLYKDEGERAQEKIKNNDWNWLEFISVIDASVQGPNVSEEGKSECFENIAKTRDLHQYQCEQLSSTLTLLALTQAIMQNSEKTTLTKANDVYHFSPLPRQCVHAYI